MAFKSLPAIQNLVIMLKEKEVRKITVRPTFPVTLKEDRGTERK
jgi:hypothetical protein